jgi:K+-sensing histidine kinase KdpD
MLNIEVNRSAKGVEQYFDCELAVSDYSMKEPGLWAGRGAERYPKERVEAALANFFTSKHLTRLRKMTLSETANILDRRNREGAEQALISFAKEYGITHVVIGRPGKKAVRLFNRALHDELIQELPGIDLVIIQASLGSVGYFPG